MLQALLRFNLGAEFSPVRERPGRALSWTIDGHPQDDRDSPEVSNVWRRRYSPESFTGCRPEMPVSNSFDMRSGFRLASKAIHTAARMRGVVQKRQTPVSGCTTTSDRPKHALSSDGMCNTQRKQRARYLGARDRRVGGSHAERREQSGAAARRRSERCPSSFAKS
jgi:hypothetical protein